MNGQDPEPCFSTTDGSLSTHDEEIISGIVAAAIIETERIFSITRVHEIPPTCQESLLAATKCAESVAGRDSGLSAPLQCPGPGPVRGLLTHRDSE